MHICIQHDARIFQPKGTPILQFKRENVRKAPRQDAPNSVCIQLQRPANLLNQLSSLHNQVGPCLRHNASHLHGTPTGTLAHDIPVKTVQNALMRHLEGVVDQRRILRLFLLLGRLSLANFLAPDFGELLVFVTTIAELTDRVNVKVILAHAYSVRAGDLLCDLRLFVGILAVELEAIRHGLGLLFLSPILERSALLVHRVLP
mmetsp:Transcript_17306/g.36499  ORF Transcript_17306/g.36499 Transcript_17306/m.36499 type:complete len:203 (-) Transcript_17306:69-677(-)